MGVNRLRILVIAMTVLLLCTNGFGDDTTPHDVMRKVAAAYQAMKTYKAEGIITFRSDSGGPPKKTETSFSILLKKPNLYLITWTQKASLPMFSMSVSGVVWSDGTQPYLCLMHKCRKISSDEMALAGATGVSGGAANTIPSLFLSTMEQPGWLAGLRDPKFQKSEKVGEEDCYVIEDSSVGSVKVTLWVSKRDYLIRKYCSSFKWTEDKSQKPIMTDKELEKAFKDQRLEVTERMIKKLRGTREQAQGKMAGSSTEVYTAISFPELTENDFRYALPEGTVLE